MLKALPPGAVTHINRVTWVGLSPAGPLHDVANKLGLFCSSSARGRGEIGRRRRLKIAFHWSAGSSPAVRTILAALALAACDRTADTGPVRVAVIGEGRPALADPARKPLNAPSRLLVDAVAQGLVRFDAAGQIEPGLAERWIVADGGLSYIFRLREARWTDGSPVTTEQVVARLRRQIVPGSRNPLAPFLTAIDEIVAMTPQVIEVRLKRPRPDLLKLFAQPELALLRGTRGTGPMASTTDGPQLTLRPRPELDGTDDGDRLDDRRGEVQLSGVRASLALARYTAGKADLVTGGGFAEWPLVAIAQPAQRDVRIDPAAGMFGLLVVRRDGFLADPSRRAAIAQAIDRAAATGWAPEERLLPEQLDSAAAPQAPAWAALPLDQRRAAARDVVAAWDKPVRVRIALPVGPGATQLWYQLAASLRAVGITAERVAPTAPTDLRLLDAVAPYDSARWYLAAACQPCGAEALAKVLAARDAPTLAQRGQRIAEADAALAADTAFIPLARPFRWSVVTPRLQGWQPNARAWHPLNRLLPDPN